MDPVEKEQKFDAIRMALSHGYLGAARSAFIAEGAFSSVEEIQRLKD